MGESARRAEVAKAAAKEAVLKDEVAKAVATEAAEAATEAKAAAESKRLPTETEEAMKHLLVLAHIVRANAGRLDRFERFDYETAIAFLRKKLGTKPLPEPIWPK
jgi:hypothetical protein